MFYSIFCTLKGKTISTISGDYADDAAAIEKARFYQQSSAADTIRVHRDAPFYPLGEMIAELKDQATTQPYTAHFYTEADWAETTIKALSAELALQRARQIESEETETLDFQSYDGGGAGVEHIEIQSADGSTVAEWRSEDLLVRLAAADMLEALEQALVALNTAPRFKVPILGVIDSYAVAAICEAAIAKAKGDA